MAAALVVVVGTWRTGAKADGDEGVTAPKVVRTDQEGGKYYQDVTLQNDRYQFFERGARTVLRSTLVETDLEKDARARLGRFSLILRAEPERHLPSPKGSAAAFLPGSRSTAYVDLDGDSTLDVMIKTGPGLQDTSILVQDRWVRVNNRKDRFTTSTEAFGTEGARYVFARGGWKKEP